MGYGLVGFVFRCNDTEKIERWLYGVGFVLSLGHLISACCGNYILDHNPPIYFAITGVRLPDSAFASWGATRFQVVAAVLGIVFLLYSFCYIDEEQRRKRKKYVHKYGFDHAAVSLLACVFWLVAGIVMAAFLDEGYYCTPGKEYCVVLLKSFSATMVVCTILDFFLCVIWANIFCEAGPFAYNSFKRRSNHQPSVQGQHPNWYATPEMQEMV